MLTNQIIGAAHNAANHAPRPTPAQDQAVQQTLPYAAVSSETKATTARPVSAATASDKARADIKEDRPAPDLPKRAELELPKRAEMRLLLIDTVPDAVPESIYEATVVDETGEAEPAEPEQSA